METENKGISQELFMYIINAFTASPFYQLLGFKVKSLAPGKAEIVVNTSEQHTNPQGMVHGGLFMSAADSAMGNAVRTLGIKTVTVDCTTSFLAAAEFGKEIVAEGEVIKSGRNIFFTEARVWCDNKLLATSRATFFKTGVIEV
ncbi:MAG: PaaI family thioesterase [Syntrophomonadaceae bacterium]|nr:PaaI family thioesterase [Syntrophomonadaceae bacterium]